MSEIGEGAPITPQNPSLKQAASKFREKLDPFQDALHRNLLISQRSQADVRPLYPPLQTWVDAGALPPEVGDYILRDVSGDTPITDTMEERMASMLDVVSERLPSAQVLEGGLDKPQAYSGVRLADLLLDRNINIVKMWATMSDANFAQFIELVTRDELPKALTSDQEMSRLLGQYKGKIKPYETARGRFAELCHDEDYYGHDEQGHETVGPMGGPAYAEYNKGVNLSEVMETLNKEFPNE